MSFRDRAKFASISNTNALQLASTADANNVHTPHVITEEKQFSGTPSNYTISTSDATVFTLAAGERGFVQNLDDAPMALKLGAGASASSFSMILKAGTAGDDGLGGSIFIEDYVGAVSVAGMFGSARCIAWKQAVS